MSKRKATDDPGSPDARQTPPPPAHTTTALSSKPSSATTSTSSSAIVIDHLAFPHIMEVIIAAADITVLYNLALTCRKYYDKLFVGPHCVITKETDGLAFAPFLQPNTKHVPTGFHQFLKDGEDDIPVGCKKLRALRVVDLKVDNIREMWGYELGKFERFIHPTVLRVPKDLPIDAPVVVYMLNYVPKDQNVESRQLHMTICASNAGDDDDSYEDDSNDGDSNVGDQTSDPAHKIVVGVHYSPNQPAAYRTLTFGPKSPTVLHFVNVGECSLDHTTPTETGFSAGDALAVISAIAFNSPETLTVVGLETITPWKFVDGSLKKMIAARFDPDAREQNIRYVLSIHRFFQSRKQRRFRQSPERFRFLTVDEYAQEVSPTMLALERGDGFTFT